MLGPRTGRFRPNGTLSRMAQQSPALQTLGALILWVGWYGFNGGSVGSVAGGRTALVASAVVNTTIAAAAGVLCTGLWLKIISKKFDSGHLNNGILSGLVAISATGPLVEPEGAFIVGVVASGFYMLGVEGLKRFRIDDVVQASAVHFMCGVWGLISAALLTTKERYRDVYSYGIFSDPGREDECCGREYFPVAAPPFVSSCPQNFVVAIGSLLAISTRQFVLNRLQHGGFGGDRGHHRCYLDGISPSTAVPSA